MTLLAQADATRLPLANGSVQTCITSPPYWGLRDYGIGHRVWGGEAACDHAWGETIKVNATNHTDKRRWQHTRNGRDEEAPTDKRVAWLRTNVDQGNICRGCGAWRGCFGLEPTIDLYVEHAVIVFREVKRVLRPDGTLWLNLGDSYANDSKWGGSTGGKHVDALHGDSGVGRGRKTTGLKGKDLCLIPHRVAMALQADGWWLRDTIIWHKPNPMPSSVTDRTTTAHDYIFLLTKSARYFYDADAIREPITSTGGACFGPQTKPGVTRTADGGHGRIDTGGYVQSRKLDDPAQRNNPLGRNKRSVWTVPTFAYAGAHFATFPPRLIEPMIRAGTSEKGCCRACGAPWKRVVGRVPTGETQKMPDGWATHKGGHGSFHRDGREMGEHRIVVMANVTINWLPSCKCPVSEPVPCKVLDIFSGAGTTAMVADRLGRMGIGTDLNAGYLTMARTRIAEDCEKRKHVNGKPRRPRPVVADTEPSLFGLTSEVA